MEWVVNATPRPLYPPERPGTHCIGGWVGPRAGRDGCENLAPPTGFDPQIVQPVASRTGYCKVLGVLSTRLFFRPSRRCMKFGSGFWGCGKLVDPLV